MASSRQVKALVDQLLAGNLVFGRDMRRSFHALVGKTAIATPFCGYWAEVDGHPLSTKCAFEEGLEPVCPHLLEVVNRYPLYLRAFTISYGKPTSYVIARTIRQAVLDILGTEGMQSAPAIILMDGEPCCTNDELKAFIEACGSRRCLAEKGTPYAKPFVEGMGATLQVNCTYPADQFAASHEIVDGRSVLTLPAEVLARTFLDAAMRGIALRREEFISSMHRVGLGLTPSKAAEIANLRWPTSARVNGEIATLGGGETFVSEEIATLDDGIYSASRSLDPLLDDLEIYLEDMLVAKGVRSHPVAAALKPFLSFLEVPRL